MRYAIAMKMQQSCCNCHNAHPDSTKTDWQPGQVRGLLEVARPHSNDWDRVSTGLIRSLMWIDLVAAGVLASLLFGLSMFKK